MGLHKVTWNQHELMQRSEQRFLS